MKNSKGYTLIEVMICVVIIAVLCLLPLYVIWTDGNLDYAVSLIKGKSVNVPMWISVIFAIVSNGVGLVFNIIVAIIKIAK